MSEPPTPTPLARSAIEPAPPTRIEHGWEVSGRRSTAALRLTDFSPLTKTLIRADPAGPVAAALDVPVGRARRDASGALTSGLAPGEWLVLGPASAAILPADGLVSVVDMTHGLALVRLAGADSAALLSKLCAVDLHDSVTPNGSAFRSLVAGVTAGVIRDDGPDDPGYLVFSERSVGQYLCDALLDAGAEFRLDVDGFHAGDF